MQHFYEKLMTHVSHALKPVSSAGHFQPKKVKTQTLGFAPFITVSRQAGSGGKPIAQKVAKLTGFNFFGKQIVEKVAKSSRLRTELLRSIDEKSRTGIQDIIHSLFNPEYVSDIQYIHKLCDVILSLSEKGNVVLLGRGSPFITSSSRGLHVRITAPYSTRVERAIKYEHVTEKKARKIIYKTEEDRKQFIRQYFDKNINKPKYFDLIINTTFMNIDAGAELIIKAFEIKFPGYLRQYKLRQKRLKNKRK